MNIQLLRIRKNNFSETSVLVSRYRVRLKRYAQIDETHFKDEARLVSYLERNPGFTVMLDERGEETDSLTLARKIQRWQDNSTRMLRFCVGDAYGFTDEIRKRADWMWRLSKLTLPGDFAWLLLWEQLFRAYAILHKTGYHH